MPTGPDYDAADIFVQARGSLNDFAAESFTDDKLVVYAQMAWEQIALKMNHAGSAVLMASTILTIPANTTLISYITAPPLPSNLTDIIYMEESEVGKKQWIPMFQRRLGMGPNEANPVDQAETLRTWAWRSQSLGFSGATRDRDVRIQYLIAEPELLVASTDLGRIIANSRGYMSRKTAGYAALFMSQDLERAAALNDEAMDFLDTVIGIATNNLQAVPVRRRAYGSSRRRGMWYPKTS